MVMREKVQTSFASVLDRLSVSDRELSKEDAEDHVTQYYDYIRKSIEKHSNDKPESGYIELDVFVEKATGMVYQLLLLPSDLTKEVPWTVAQVGIKPDDGVDKYITLSQNERRKKFGEGVVKVQAIHYLDHGYGAGIPAEKGVVDGLATGELPKMNSSDLLVMLMTKGSGGTYADPKDNGSRNRLPEYDMDATYAQLAEATFGIDGYLANTVKEYYINNPIFGSDGVQLMLSKHELASALLDLAELKSGTWASNRGVSVVAHSMAGWEAIRAYLGEVFGRFTVGMEKYREYLVDSYEESKKVNLTAYKQAIVGIPGENKAWIETTVEALSKNQSLFIGDNEISQIILKDGEESVGYKSLRAILYGERPNIIFEALTPLIRGEKVSGVRISNIKNERHTLLTSILHAPELRLLIGLRKNFGKLGGMVGYRVGKWIKLLDCGVNRLVEDSAYGVNVIRATHTVGLKVGLDAVVMDDEVLKEARGMSQETIAQHSVKKVGVIHENGANGTISRLRIHAGGKDPVLKSVHMRGDAMAMITGTRDQLDDLFVMHVEGSHYLPKDAHTLVWEEVFSRRKAVVEHRMGVVDTIVRSLNITI